MQMEVIKQIIINLPQGLFMGLVLNGSLIVLAYFLFWKRFKARFKRWRIQIRQRVDSTQIRSELKNSMATLIVGALLSSVVTYLGTQGYTKIYLNFSDYHSLWGITGFFLLLIVGDGWFYWVHRLLHHPSIYRYVHRVHHESIDVNPFTSMSFHWLEALLLSLWIIPVALLCPIYAPFLFLMQILGILNNIKAHLGYEFYPSYFHNSWLRFLTTSTHHNMHHSKFNGNYGLFFRFWDNVCHTEFRDYEAEYDTIQARKREKPLTPTVKEHHNIMATVTVHFKGEHEVQVQTNETVLSALLREEIDVPYACQLGKCGTCKSKLICGDVDMLYAEALTEQELQEGYILICQSIPKTERVEIGIG